MSSHSDVAPPNMKRCQVPYQQCAIDRIQSICLAAVIWESTPAAVSLFAKEGVLWIHVSPRVYNSGLLSSIERNFHRSLGFPGTPYGVGQKPEVCQRCRIAVSFVYLGGGRRILDDGDLKSLLKKVA